jgi:hypothetical protein
MLYSQGLKRIVILKARQLDFSTLLGIICTDELCWTTGRRLSLDPCATKKPQDEGPHLFQWRRNRLAVRPLNLLDHHRVRRTLERAA